MFHSYTKEDEKFDMFEFFLQKLIDGDARYNQFVTPVIENVRALAKQEKNFYTIDRKNFSIIVFFYDKDKTFFEDLEPSNIEDNTYKKMQDLLHQRYAVVA